jgi:hypothetical protein
MTRKEERELAAYNNDRESSKENQQYFIEGAEWADSTMIEKACDWLDKNLTDYEGNTMGNIPFGYINDIVRDFKKAMYRL